ncbi:class I adenylate-forming enzyme family protein [Thermomonospora cellulosilytica]|uniref:Acyl-CoA synthetase (AMP-forming)/AMP-acid ligase II n=1 Tax=Thermomonospora cellulosilytica TaxID=1411118 RepID=A0A7W3N0R8_9ACTN|nr:AMP-binding protein [Thermomonospora cellulosilytica]MBA9005412.1 acyl-CoA synthetase (AMP-forming)/AMP-acid ligase II [Thermomonospora cellulosilytica]
MTILDKAAAAGDRTAVTAGGRSLTASELRRLARAAARRFQGRPAVLYLGANHLAYPVALFGAALAGVPFVPLNYRLGDHQLTALQERHPGALVLRPADLDGFVEDAERDADTGGPEPGGGQDSVAVLLYTSGTTAEPKAAVLRHRHLLAYVTNTLKFASAKEGDAALVAVPPYHVAGLANLLANLWMGRRVVYMASFDPRGWLETVRRERITHALLVPTMLARIVAEVRGDDAGTPTLRSISYGGARTPLPVLERAMRIFPKTGFVNVYGLTETASSIAALGPKDHREALESTDPKVRARLQSVGRALPGTEFQIRREDGAPVGAGEPGLVFVRGAQISGEYGGGLALDAEGWFATRDRGWLDADGYLFIEGRADDTIIRGGENIAPAEIEDVLLAHPGVAEAAVVGVPDPEWGQRIVAVCVGDGDPDDIRRWVRDRLRSAKTPDAVVFRADLPKTDTGKVLRRVLLNELEKTHA